MAIVALATGREDLEHRLGQIIVGAGAGPVAIAGARARPQGVGRDGDAAQGRDLRRTSCRRSRAARPSCTPGRSATSRTAATAFSPRAPASRSATSSSPRPGFGSDLGAEKFFDIKCRVGGLNPEAAVLVATVRSLKMQGGADKRALSVGDLAALERGLPHLEHHIDNVRQFGVPVVVAINRFVADTDAELTMVHDYAARSWASTSRSAKCGRRAAPAARRSRARCSRCSTAAPRSYAPHLRRDAARARQDRDDRPAACTAATASTTRPRRRARSTTSRASACSTRRSAWRRRSTRSPTIPRGSAGRRGFRITVNEVYGSAGAGFVVAQDRRHHDDARPAESAGGRRHVRHARRARSSDCRSRPTTERPSDPTTDLADDSA